MTVRYTKQTQKSGASIGTVITVPKPQTWTDSTNINTEGSNWNIEALYPGWLPCDGRTLNVSDYYALYQVIGNTYGGTTNSTFKLPDYRSKKLMGTGVVDGNKGSGPSLTPNSGPTGTPGGTIDLPGSQGGIYKITTVRQLPPGSEITPGGVLKPDVFFDVGGNVLGRPIEFVSGSAYQNHGTGIGETGRFLDPLTTNGGRYIGLGTTGTSPFNSTQYTREVRITNLDLTGYGVVRIFAIAGNEANGGERVNNAGEGLRVIWPNGSESVILPSAIDVGGLEIFDEAYSSWREIAIDIPSQYRTTGVTIRFRQDLNASTNNPPGEEGAHNLTDPNAYDMIGIQQIGFRGGEIGGDADDTFGLGKFSTSGFSDTTLEIQPNFSGNASWSAGVSGSGTATKVITSAPAHTHEVKHVIRDSGTASGGNPVYGNYDLPFNNISAGSLVTYNRSDQPIRSHSHYIGWGNIPPVSSFGNDNNAGNGLFNSVQTGGGVHSAFYGNFSSNVGEVINKTINLINEGGININSGTFTLSNNSKTVFDNALSVRLEAAEEIVMMTPYFRLRYIIKAY